MKKIICALLGASLFAACQTEPQTVIQGHLEGIESDSLLVMYGTPGDRTNRTTDTLAMNRGKFRFVLPESKLQEIRLWALPSSKPAADGSRKALSMQAVMLPLLPDQTLQIEGSFEEYTLSGSPFYDEMQQFRNSIAPTLKKIQEIQTTVKALSQKKAPQTEIMEAYAPMRTLSLAISDQTFDYIKQHPDSDVSVSLLESLSQKQAAEALELISPRAQQGIMGLIYQNTKKRIEREAARKEAMRTVVEGAQAPDFNVKTLDGKEFALASLRGKYVVLDFWGTWCGWCIKGMPEMKAAYEKYHDKLEFVGIACNDTEERWKQKIEELQLPWIHTLNREEHDLAIAYGVSGFPTKFILDKEGKIVKKVVGESPEFYETIERLMK